MERNLRIWSAFSHVCPDNTSKIFALMLTSIISEQTEENITENQRNEFQGTNMSVCCNLLLICSDNLFFMSSYKENTIPHNNKRVSLYNINSLSAQTKLFISVCNSFEQLLSSYSIIALKWCVQWNTIITFHTFRFYTFIHFSPQNSYTFHWNLFHLYVFHTYMIKSSVRRSARYHLYVLSFDAALHPLSASSYCWCTLYQETCIQRRVSCVKLPWT